MAGRRNRLPLGRRRPHAELTRESAPEERVHEHPTEDLPIPQAGEGSSSVTDSPVWRRSAGGNLRSTGHRLMRKCLFGAGPLSEDFIEYEARREATHTGCFAWYSLTVFRENQICCGAGVKSSIEELLLPNTRMDKIPFPLGL